MPDTGVGVVMRVLVSVVAVAMMVAGCSSPTDEPTPSPTDPTPSASPTPSVDAEAAQRALDEAAILDVYQRFWVANAEAERGNPDPALYAGIAAGPAVEVELAIASQYQANGIAKAGEPTLSDVTVVIDGDSARVGACVDHSTWVPEGASPPSPPVVATEVVVERVSGAWMVYDYVEPTVELPC